MPTAPRRVKAVENVEEETVDNAGPIVVKSSGKKAERTVLFTIDDVEYTVPTKPGPNVTLKFLDEMRRTGNEMYAAMSLLETMLGKEKYQDLLNYDELTDELTGQILEQVIGLAMARVEEAAGK